MSNSEPKRGSDLSPELWDPTVIRGNFITHLISVNLKLIDSGYLGLHAGGGLDCPLGGAG